MKKEVKLYVGCGCISSDVSDCIHVVGSSCYLENLADYCWYMQFSFVKGCIRELWFYRGLLIFQDDDEWFSFVVPILYKGTCRFSSLSAAKSAITRSLKMKGGVL